MTPCWAAKTNASCFLVTHDEVRRIPGKIDKWILRRHNQRGYYTELYGWNHLKKNSLVHLTLLWATGRWTRRNLDCPLDQLLIFLRLITTHFFVFVFANHLLWCYFIPVTRGLGAFSLMFNLKNPSFLSLIVTKLKVLENLKPILYNTKALLLNGLSIHIECIISKVRNTLQHYSAQRLSFRWSHFYPGQIQKLKRPSTV